MANPLGFAASDLIDVVSSSALCLRPHRMPRLKKSRQPGGAPPPAFPAVQQRQLRHLEGDRITAVIQCDRPAAHAAHRASPAAPANAAAIARAMPEEERPAAGLPGPAKRHSHMSSRPPLIVRRPRDWRAGLATSSTAATSPAPLPVCPGSTAIPHAASTRPAASRRGSLGVRYHGCGRYNRRPVAIEQGQR